LLLLHAEVEGEVFQVEIVLSDAQLLVIRKRAMGELLLKEGGARARVLARKVCRTSEHKKFHILVVETLFWLAAADVERLLGAFLAI